MCKTEGSHGSVFEKVEEMKTTTTGRKTSARIIAPVNLFTEEGDEFFSFKSRSVATIANLNWPSLLKSITLMCKKGMCVHSSKGRFSSFHRQCCRQANFPLFVFKTRT